MMVRNPIQKTLILRKHPSCASKFVFEYDWWLPTTFFWLCCYWLSSCFIWIYKCFTRLGINEFMHVCWKIFVLKSNVAWVFLNQIFLCPTLVSCWLIHLSDFITELKIHHLHSFITTHNDFDSADPSVLQDAFHIWTQLNDLALHEFSQLSG